MRATPRHPALKRATRRHCAAYGTPAKGAAPDEFRTVDAMTSKNEYTRSGIAVMTAWANGEDGDDVAFSATTAVDIGEEHGYEHLSIGLINLCAFLLVRREKEQGITINETLREAARLHAADD